MMRTRHLRLPARRRGMTLIELILVMALLVVMLSLTTPALSNFFAGRRSREEARRLLALTRFAREEAISRATPLELWLDADEGCYGLRPLLEATDEDFPAREFSLAEDVALELDRTELNERGEGIILFLPDGTLDESSLTEIIVRDAREGEIAIERSNIGMGYEILQDHR